MTTTGECGRRRLADQAIEFSELPPEQVIELGHRVSRMLWTKPPKPVRALADRQLLLDLLQIGVQPRTLPQRLVDVSLGSSKQVPRTILVRLAYPGGERTIDPAAGNELRQVLD